MPRKSKKAIEAEAKAIQEAEAQKMIEKEPDPIPEDDPVEDSLSSMIAEAIKGTMDKYQKKTNKELDAKNKTIADLQKKIEDMNKMLSDKQAEMDTLAETSEKKIDEATKALTEKEAEMIALAEASEQHIQQLKESQKAESLAPAKKLLQMMRDFVKTAEGFVSENQDEDKVKSFETLCKEYEDALNQLDGSIVSGQILFSQVKDKKTKLENRRRIVYSRSEKAWKVENEAEGNISKVTTMINDLTYECYNAKIPIVICSQYKKNGNEETLKSILSPEAVGYKPDDPLMIYDIMCVLSGNFTTVPKQSKEEEIDPFAMNSEIVEE